jgi:hypothetical protein
MPREPAYAAERRQDAEAKAASERAKDRTSEASVRLSGHGQPRTPATGGRPTDAKPKPCGVHTAGNPAQSALGGSYSKSFHFIARRKGSMRSTTSPFWKMRTVPLVSLTATATLRVRRVIAAAAQ